MTVAPQPIVSGTDTAMAVALMAEGYWPVKKLDNGEWAGVFSFLFTTAICVGLTLETYKTRFCYGTKSEAEEAFEHWDGEGFPPGYWKQKG